MKDKKTKEECENSYELRREFLWKDVKDYDEDNFPKIISYFCKSGGSAPITGKVFTPKPPEFKCEINIKKCFSVIKEAMATKSGNPRASMLKLKDYEITAWSSLLEYLRFSWQEGEEKVLLTGSEYYMLFPKQTKKK